MTKTIRIATRMSPLAMWQAQSVQAALMQHFPALQIELLPMKTEGDKFLDDRLIEIGGKGLFVKELEQALLDKRADIAVHSMKDVPADFPAGLTLAVICAREDSRDVFVSHKAQQLQALPVNATLGTSSLRRQCQVLALRPDINVINLRGNVHTRLGKLDSGQYDAIILAAAGLKRLQLTDRIASYFDPQQLLPAAGQGAMGIECRSDDQEVLPYLMALEDKPSTLCVNAERAVSARLQGGCQLPLACYAQLQQQQLHVWAIVGSVDGQQLLKANASGNRDDWQQIADQVCEQLLTQGAQDLLDQCKH